MSEPNPEINRGAKCPDCGLVNFASDTSCKRCHRELSTDQRLASRETLPVAEAQTPPVPISNLVQCPDCGSRISRNAESCPTCGRFFQSFRPTLPYDRDRQWWAYTIGWGVIASGFILFLIVVGCIMVLMILGTGLGQIQK